MITKDNMANCGQSVAEEHHKCTPPIAASANYNKFAIYVKEFGEITPKYSV